MDITSYLIGKKHSNLTPDEHTHIEEEVGSATLKSYDKNGHTFERTYRRCSDPSCALYNETYTIEETSPHNFADYGLPFDDWGDTYVQTKCSECPQMGKDRYIGPSE